MIEAKIDELIKALNSNTDALLGRGQTPLAATVADAAPTPAPEVKETKSTKKVKPTEPATPPTPPPPPAEPEKPAGPTVAELRDIAQKCLDNGVKPDQIRAECAKYDSKRVSETKPEHFAALAADLQKLLDASAAT